MIIESKTDLYKVVTSAYSARNSSINDLSSLLGGITPKEARTLTQACGYHHTLKTENVSCEAFLHDADVDSIYNKYWKSDSVEDTPSFTVV